MRNVLLDWRSWSFVFLMSVLGFADTSFLSPELQNADAESLRRRLATYGDSSPQSELEQAMHWMALGALERESGHPHAAHRAWSKVEDFCVGWRMSQYESLSAKLAARAAAVCALAGAERTAQGLPWMHYFSAKRLAADTQNVLLGDAEDSERLHVTGRLRAALSPVYGQDFRNSLMSWRVLERSAPTAAATDYWLGLALERQGNLPLAAQSIERAAKLTVPDPRAVLHLKRSETRSFDALDFGWGPIFGASPARGMGAGMRVWDDRLGDAHRSVAAAVLATTRGNLSGGAEFTEGQWFAPFRLALQVTASHRVRDYFGLGVASTYASITDFRTTTWDADALLSTPVGGSFEVAAGVTQRNFASDILPAGVVGKTMQGILVEAKFDTRDRATAPRQGFFGRLRQEWLFTQPGTVLITRTRLHGAAHWRLSMRHTVHANAAVLATNGSVPYNALSDLFDTDMPGVREYRLMESQAAALWFTYRYQLLAWLRVGAFGSLGAVAVDLAGLPGAARAGAGLEVQFIGERSPRFAPLWSFGLFNGEWIFQGGLRSEL
jgi:hypothetical protein